MKNGGKNVCPNGWPATSDAKWTTLTDFLAGTGVAGGELKETGITHWKAPNIGATNTPAFTTLPGGNRFSYGVFDLIQASGYWWSSTAYRTADAFRRAMFYYGGTVHRAA